MGATYTLSHSLTGAILNTQSIVALAPSNNAMFAESGTYRGCTYSI